MTRKVKPIYKDKKGNVILHLSSNELNDSWLSSLRLGEEEFERRDNTPMVYLSKRELDKLIE